MLSSLFKFLGLNLIGVALAVPGVRMSYPHCPSGKIDFFPAPEGLQALNLPLGLISTALQFKTVDSGGRELSQCSASVVSDSGTVLTDGHCVEECLARAGVYQRSPEGLRIDPLQLAKTTCDLVVNGESIKATVLASNDCPSRESKSRNPGSLCKGLDYALLRLDSPTLSKRNCLKVGERPVSVDSNVAALHYPGVPSSRQIFRNGARDTLGNTLSVNSGSVIAPRTNCFKKIDLQGPQGEQPGPVEFANSATTKQLLDYVNSGNVLQTTVDILEASSGGSLIDARGNLVGIARNFRPHEQNQYIECSGATFFTAIAPALKDILTRFPELPLNEILRCERNLAIRTTPSTTDL